MSASLGGKRRTAPIDPGDVLAAIPDPVFVFGPVIDDTGAVVELTYDFVNDAGLRLYGLARDAVVGHGQLELFPSARTLGIFDTYLRVLDSGEATRFEVPWFDENGVEGAFGLAVVRHAGRLVVTAQDNTSRLRAEQALEASRRDYRLLAESATDIVLRADANSVLQWVSPSVTRLLGWRPDALLGRAATELVHPDDMPAFERSNEQVRSGRAASYDARFLRADGGYRWMSVRVRPVLDEDGTVIGRIGGWRDIQAEVEAHRALEESRRRYRMLAENASDLVLAADLAGAITWVSESVRSLLGWRPEQVLGQMLATFVHPDDAPLVLARLASGKTTAGPGDETRARCADGTFRWVAWTSRRTDDIGDGRPGWVGGVVDISARKGAEEQLAFATEHDLLTGLPNRDWLLRAIGAATGPGPRHLVAVLLLDLDHFRTINDALGHAVGDRLLVAAAQRVQASVGPEFLVARSGGDELVVLLPHVQSRQEATRVAELLVQRLRRPLQVTGAGGEATDLFATASIGIAMAESGSGMRAVDLVRDAETAMYAAKSEGRNRVAVFNERMRHEADHRHRLHSELRRALDRDELMVWYQPEIGLSDGSLLAVEALVRWAHPDGTVRIADEFIDIAERSGLILDLGAWVVREAAAQAARWTHDARLSEITLWLNLSPLQLREPDLLRDLDEALERHALDPGRIGIEITEQVLLENVGTAGRNLQGIHQRGIRLAIDDFGTGYGALTYLHDFAVDAVKIDRFFVRDIEERTRARSIVAGIIALAQSVGLRTIAEGVETPGQAEILRELGCTAAQGFLYSPAVAADQVGAVAHAPAVSQPG